MHTAPTTASPRWEADRALHLGTSDSCKSSRSSALRASKKFAAAVPRRGWRRWRRSARLPLCREKRGRGAPVSAHNQSLGHCAICRDAAVVPVQRRTVVCCRRARPLALVGKLGRAAVRRIPGDDRAAGSGSVRAACPDAGTPLDRTRVGRSDRERRDNERNGRHGRTDWGVRAACSAPTRNDRCRGVADRTILAKAPQQLRQPRCAGTADDLRNSRDNRPRNTDSCCPRVAPWASAARRNRSPHLPQASRWHPVPHDHDEPHRHRATRRFARRRACLGSGWRRGW